MKYAIFNRLRDEKHSSNEPLVYEFIEPIEFILTDEDEPKVVCFKLDITFNNVITPPQKFYDEVLSIVKEQYKEGKLDNLVKVLYE